MLTFYDNDFSTCAQKVRLTLHEKGANWNTHWLDLRAGDQHKPEYLKLNPNGVVPTIIDDGDVIIESSIIIQYLDDTLSQAPLLTPSAPLQRARMRAWLQRTDTGLHADIGGLSIAVAFRHEIMAKTKTPEGLEAFLAASPNPAVRDRLRSVIELGVANPFFKVGLRNWLRAVGDVENVLGQSDYIAGPNYSLADIALLPYILRLDHLGVLAPLANDHPQTMRWYENARARPASIAALDNTISQEKIAFMRQCAANEAAAIAEMMQALRAE